MFPSFNDLLAGAYNCTTWPHETKLSSSQKECSDNLHKVSCTKLHIYICTLTDCPACSSSLLGIEECLVPCEASHLLHLHLLGWDLVPGQLLPHGQRRLELFPILLLQIKYSFTFTTYFRY